MIFLSQMAIAEEECFPNDFDARARKKRYYMKLHGVFVGINQYQDRNISSLKYARVDAQNFYKKVLGSLSASDINLQLLIDKQGTKQKILKVIGESLPRVVSKDDLVLLYFAGHGSPETSGYVDTVSRYLITYDTEYASIFATAIDLERDLTRLIERIPGNLIVVLLDTCFSGRAGGRTFEGPLLRQSKSGWREGIKLSDINLGEGRVILAACKDTEVAYEDPSLGQGIFTYYLLKTLTDPDVAEPWISLNTLYEKVSQSVHFFTQGRQNPVLNGRLSLARLPIFR